MPRIYMILLAILVFLLLKRFITLYFQHQREKLKQKEEHRQIKSKIKSDWDAETIDFEEIKNES